MPSSLLELGWESPVSTDHIKPFPRRMPDDIIPSLCRQLDPQEDIHALLTLQRVSQAAYKVATRRLYSHIELRTRQSLDTYLHLFARAQEPTNRLAEAIHMIRTISITHWDLAYARQIVVASSSAFVGLPKSTKHLLPGEIGLVLGEHALEDIMRTEASHGGEPDDDDTADEVATMGLRGGRITSMAARLGGPTGGSWIGAGPFDGFLRGADLRDVNRIALNILFNRLAPLTELCVTLPQVARCPARQYNEHPTQYSIRCLDTLTQATRLADLPVVNVHNGRYDDPLSFSFAGKCNRIYLSAASGPFGSYTPEIIESGLLNAYAKGRFERPVRNEVHLRGKAVPRTEHEWGSMLLQAYRALCMRTYPGARGEREYRNRIKTMRQTLGKEAVSFAETSGASCGCGIRVGM